MYYLIALCVIAVSIFLVIVSFTDVWKRNILRRNSVILRRVSIIAIFCSIILVVITGVNDIERHFENNRKVQCDRVKQLYPDKEFILTDTCYIHMGNSLYMKYGSVSVKLYTKQEVMDNGN